MMRSDPSFGVRAFPPRTSVSSMRARRTPADAQRAEVHE